MPRCRCETRCAAVARRVYCRFRGHQIRHHAASIKVIAPPATTRKITRASWSNKLKIERAILPMASSSSVFSGSAASARFNMRECTSWRNIKKSVQDRAEITPPSRRRKRWAALILSRDTMGHTIGSFHNSQLLKRNTHVSRYSPARTRSSEYF